MKTEKIVWGMILVFIGGIFLLENFDVIDFYWLSIFKFWPLILIVIGVNMLFSRTDFAAGPYLSVVIAFLVLMFIGYMGVSDRRSNNWSWNEDRSFRFDYGDDDDSVLGRYSARRLTSPWTSPVAEAELTIRGGATTFVIGDTTAQLVDALVKGSGSNYYIRTTTSDDSVKRIDLDVNRGKNRFKFKDLEGNRANIKLNSAPLWNIDVNIGAGETNFDFSKFKVKSLDFKGGAASLHAKLGVPVSTTHVSANTGASEVEFLVPESVGCMITVKSGFSARDFEGFTKQDDGSYTTSNFAGSEKKIIIDLKGGMSDFEVKRYKN